MFTKIKQAILLTLLVCAVQPVYANDTFTLEDYVPLKFTDLIWKLDGDINGSARNLTDGSLDDFRLDSFYKNKYSNYNVELGSFALYMNETLNQLLNSSMKLKYSFQSSTSERYIQRTREQRLRQVNIDKTDYSKKLSSFSIAPRTTYKRYVKNDFFFSTSFSGSFAYNYSIKDKIENKNTDYKYYLDSVFYSQSTSLRDENFDERRYFVSFNFTVGNGRQYVGRFAFTAYNMVEELKKKDLLLKQPDKAIMVALTDIIYQYENSHTIDRRLKKIEKYDAIYSFLLDNKIVKENKHLGMLLVQDAFDMFPRELRRFGFSKSIGIGFRYNYSSYHKTSLENKQNLSYKYQTDLPTVIDTVNYFAYAKRKYSREGNERMWKYAVASISFEKPINMKWQFDAYASGRLFFDSYEHNSSRYSYEIKKKYDLNASFRSSYFYSSRTIWKSGITYNYSRNKNKIDDDRFLFRQKDESRWRFGIETTIEYRLNIPTTLQGKIRYSNYAVDSVYRDEFDKYRDGTNFNFSLSLSHFIY